MPCLQNFQKHLAYFCLKQVAEQESPCTLQNPALFQISLIGYKGRPLLIAVFCYFVCLFVVACILPV